MSSSLHSATTSCAPSRGACVGGARSEAAFKGAAARADLQPCVRRLPRHHKQNANHRVVHPQAQQQPPQKWPAREQPISALGTHHPRRTHRHVQHARIGVCGGGGGQQDAAAQHGEQRRAAWFGEPRAEPSPQPCSDTGACEWRIKGRSASAGFEPKTGIRRTSPARRYRLDLGTHRCSHRNVTAVSATERHVQRTHTLGSLGPARSSAPSAH